MSALVEVYVAIAAASVELLIHLLALVFSSSYLVHYTKGAVRVFHALSALSASHLLLALVRGISGQLNPIILPIVFNKWVMLGSLITLIVSLAAIFAMRSIGETKSKPNTRTTQDAADRSTLVFLPFALAFADVIGGFSIFSAQTKRRTLRERLFDAGAAKISQQCKERGTEALTFAERLLKRDIKNSIPCLPEPS